MVNAGNRKWKVTVNANWSRASTSGSDRSMGSGTSGEPVRRGGDSSPHPTGAQCAKTKRPAGRAGRAPCKSRRRLLLARDAEELQEHLEQVDEAQIERERAEDGELVVFLHAGVFGVGLLDHLRVVGGQPGEHDHA